MDFFFASFLPVHRGVSRHTVASYRQCFTQFVSFLEKRTGAKIETLDLSVLTYDVILDFLSFIEKKNGVCANTRNQRGAAIKSFIRCCILIAPGHAQHLSSLLHIPQKRIMKKAVDYLSDEELERIFTHIDLSSPDGFRDFTLVKFMYNTGCRASEAADMRLSWLDLDRGFAHIWGKGAKERIIPLTNSAVSFLEIYLRSERRRPEKGYEDILFINRLGCALTRSGVYKIILKYAARAAKFTPSLARRKITPHTLRHTTAMHMLNNGVSYKTIQAWLGHADMDTTRQYAKINLAAKKRALESFSRFDDMILKAFLSSKEFDWNANPEVRQWLINLQNKDCPGD